MDFTFVCPTEIVAFSDSIQQFKDIGCEVVGWSTDSVYSHLAWCNTSRKQVRRQMSWFSTFLFHSSQIQNSTEIFGVLKQNLYNWKFLE